MRQQLVTAFAFDTIAAARACSLVETVLVVTDDATIAAELRALGVQAIPDGVASDLNEALRLGAAEITRQRPELRIAALLADLPALRSTELDEALLLAASYRLAFVADADAVGTTLLVAHSVAEFTPRFGAGSRSAHLSLGAVELRPDLPGLRRDVDTTSELAVAAGLGLGTRTAQVCAIHQLVQP